MIGIIGIIHVIDMITMVYPSSQFSIKVSPSYPPGITEIILGQGQISRRRVGFGIFWDGGSGSSTRPGFYVQKKRTGKIHHAKWKWVNQVDISPSFITNDYRGNPFIGKNYGQSPFLMGKSSISTGPFSSSLFVCLPGRVPVSGCFGMFLKIPLKKKKHMKKIYGLLWKVCWVDGRASKF